MRVLSALRAHLNEHLFPAAPGNRTTVGRGERLVLLLALLAIAIILQLVRVGPSASLNSLWAEDGSIFLQGALTQHFYDVLFNTYAGYLVVVPRLIAEIASHFPLRSAAAVISVLSASVVACSGLIVWKASAGHIANPYLRGTLALLTVLVPVGGLEVVDSASYVSWYMLFAVFWILLWRPATSWGALFASLFIVAAALSNPGVWFFIPLAALRALTVRNGRDLAIVGSFAIGAGVQIPIALGHPSAVEPLWTHDIWVVYLQRVVDGAPLGLRLGGIGWAHLGWSLPIAIAIAWLVGLGLGARNASRGSRYVATIAILTSLCMFVVSLYERAVGPAMLWPGGVHNANGGRYSIVPALLLVSAALVLVDGSRRGNREPRGISWAIATPVTILLVALGTSFYVRSITVRGTPSWTTALEDAATACATEGNPAAVIPVSPPGFTMTLPCDRISSFRRAEPAAGPS